MPDWNVGISSGSAETQAAVTALGSRSMSACSAAVKAESPDAAKLAASDAVGEVTFDERGSGDALPGERRFRSSTCHR